jgi:phosphoglycolate phosphatase-like HAD superfamily hydrolase
MTDSHARPALLALDFDGVLCDSVRETFRSSWAVCREIGAARDDTPPAAIRDAYVRTRPVVEFGWEFPVLLLGLLDGVPEQELAGAFHSWRDRILARHELAPAELGRRFDGVRDRAIRADLDGWLADQGLYPGVADRLCDVLDDGVRTFILTTKEGRFAHRLLAVAGVPFPPAQIWGKEQARPKPELLRALIREYGVPPERVWFLEDRVNALKAVERESDLDAVRLFFAAWGYALPADRAEAQRDPRIASLALADFCGEFSRWAKADG